jgi:hypothetical protein
VRLEEFQTNQTKPWTESLLWKFSNRLMDNKGKSIMAASIVFTRT